jgi:Zn-dependent peptidase ImmA (M78 family)
MEIPVVTPNEIKGLTQEDLNELFGRGSSNWSALTLVTPKKTVIIHNSSHSVGRQESNIMHELSHLICDHQPSEIMQIDGFAFPIRTCDKSQEEEADWVCGCLKLPRDGILWAVRSGMTHEAIADRFASSLDLVRYRIRITGVDRQVQRARQKWRR